MREREIAKFIPWGPASIQVAISKKSPYISHSHRVSGLMLANHTSVATLFKRIVLQYDKMRKRNAYLEGYKKEAMFADGLGEFDEARAVVMDLIADYEEAEMETYIDPTIGVGKDGQKTDIPWWWNEVSTEKLMRIFFFFPDSSTLFFPLYLST